MVSPLNFYYNTYHIGKDTISIRVPKSIYFVSGVKSIVTYNSIINLSLPYSPLISSPTTSILAREYHTLVRHEKYRAKSTLRCVALRLVSSHRTNTKDESARQRARRTHELRGMRMAWSSPFKTKRSPRREPTSLTCLTRVVLLCLAFWVYSFFRRKTAGEYIRHIPFL